MCRTVFPFPEWTSDSAYIAKYKKAPGFETNFTDLVTGARAQTEKENQKQLYEHAKAYLKDETDRGASIIARAQALLIAQTFFGTFLAFGTGLIGQKDLFNGLFRDVGGYVLVGLLGYIALLVLLQTINALRATGALNYPRIGTSELRAVVGLTECEMIRELALKTLQNYRDAAIVNTWRVIHLKYAQQCLANTAIALAFLVGAVFYLTVVRDPPPPFLQ
jgi:hypothetical protein